MIVLIQRLFVSSFDDVNGLYDENRQDIQYDTVAEWLKMFFATDIITDRVKEGDRYIEQRDNTSKDNR